MPAFIRRSALAVTILVGIVAMAALAASPHAVIRDGEWPQFNGPNRDNISTETGLLADWSTNAPALEWTAPKLGKGFSSVSIQDGRIFTMGDRDDQQCVIALNQADGKELWSTPIGKPKAVQYPGPRCTPTCDGKLIYALTNGGDLACLEAASGKVQWKVNFEKDFGGKMMSGWGYSESPLVDGNKLVCTPGGKDAMIVALDKTTGEPLWKTTVPDLGANGNDGAAYSSIVISDGAGVKQYVQLVGKGLIGVDAETGKFLWNYNKIANKTANIPTPIVRGDYVFDSTGYGTGAALLKLSKADGGVKADEVYFLKADKLQNHHGGMVLVGDYLYGGSGHNRGEPICVEFLTGKIKWKQGHGPGKDSAAVTYADGKLYFRYQDGVMALIDCTPEKYKELGTFKIPDVSQPSWPHPVIAGGRLYLREQDNLLCYKLK